MQVIQVLVQMLVQAQMDLQLQYQDLLFITEEVEEQVEILEDMVLFQVQED